METIKIRRFWLIVILSIFTYLIIGIYADIKNLTMMFENFQWGIFLILIIFSSISYALRFLKWQYMLKISGIELPASFSFFVFLSGLSMVITPAKVGEVWKSYLIKEKTGINISATLPVVIFDRATDFISLLILSTIGFFYLYSNFLIYSLIIILFTIFLIYVSTSESFLKFTIRIIGRKMEKFKENLYEAQSVFRKLLKVRLVTIFIGVGLVSWFMESLVLAIILDSFNYKVDLLLSTFIYSFSLIIGTLSFLPGGIGATEFTTIGLLKVIGLESYHASFVSILSRLATFWYATFLGLATYFSLKRKFLK